MTESEEKKQLSTLKELYEYATNKIANLELQIESYKQVEYRKYFFEASIIRYNELMKDKTDIDTFKHCADVAVLQADILVKEVVKKLLP